jgi:undecaprenyl-diphosphatase
MVILPILAANVLDLKDMFSSETGMAGAGAEPQIGILPLVVGFLAAFLSGLLACSWMLRIVRRGKLLYFGIYCLIVGIIAIFAGLF